MRYLSPEGLANLKKELDDLKMKRQEIARRLEEAKDLGDLAENTEYMEAREAQGFNEGRIAELTEIIKNAIIIEQSKGSGLVQVGSKIKVSDDKSIKEILSFTIVGSEEVRPEEGKISNESPLGKAFLGRRAGDEVEVAAPKGKIKYKILAIE